MGQVERKVCVEVQEYGQVQYSCYGFSVGVLDYFEYLCVFSNRMVEWCLLYYLKEINKEC